MIAVSDTGPLLYLCLIDHIDLLPQIFNKVLVPQAVADEPSHPLAPLRAAKLIQDCPSWLQICVVPFSDTSLNRLGRGERQAIALAVSVAANVLLTDDRSAKATATQIAGIAVSGTIGVLYQAAMHDRMDFTAKDFDAAIKQLLETNFRCTPALRKMIAELSRKLHVRGSQ